MWSQTISLGSQKRLHTGTTTLHNVWQSIFQEKLMMIFEDFQMEIVPYVMTQKYRKKIGVTLLIGTDRGKGAWRSLIKIFQETGNINVSFTKDANMRRKI
jgi:hypothetical protein